MAKNPCKFKIKSTGEWVDAVTLKKRLNDGLLDEYVSSGVVKLKSFEAQQPKSDSEQVQEPVTETKSNALRDVESTAKALDEKANEKKSKGEIKGAKVVGDSLVEINKDESVSEKTGISQKISEGFSKAGEQSKIDKSPKALGEWLILNAQTGDKIIIDEDTYWVVERKTDKKGNTEVELQQYFRNENDQFENNPSAVKLFNSKHLGTDMAKLATRDASDLFEASYRDANGNVVVEKAKYIPTSKNSKSISEAYHKAKADGSNPELVKAVEELISKEQSAPVSTDSKADETETVQEQVESVTLPPFGNIKRPRTFERIDGEWKLKDGDGHTEVSDSIKQQVQMEYETQQRADQERMTEKAKREKGAVEEKIMKFLDGMKIDPNSAKSTILPIPPKVWNDFVDLVKTLMEKGADFAEAVTKAKREYFAPKVKDGELNKKDVDSAVSKFKRQYATKVAKQVEAKQGDGTPIGKAIKEAKSEMSDLEAEPAKAKSTKSTYGNRATIRKAIKAYDAGAKDATKKLQDIKSAVVEYIKENVDFKDSDTIKGQDSKVMINQVRSAKDMASLKKAFDLIDNVATRQYDRKKKRLINQLKNLVSRKNLISGTGAKKKSKIGVDAEMELKDFITNIMPTDEQLNNMSLNDLQDYYDMAQGIIEVGKYDVKQKSKFKQRKNRMDQAVAISAWTIRDKVNLNSLDEVRNHLANGGHAIVNGEFVKSVSTLNDIVKSDDDVTEIIGLPFIRGIKETTQTPWYKKNFNPSKNKLFYNNLFRYLYKNKEIKTLLEEKIVNPLTEAEIRKDDEIKQVTSEIIKNINRIFGVSRTSEVALGKTTKAMLRLNEIPKGKSFRKELGSGETDIFTNNALVMMYSHLQTEGGKEMLESSANHINTDAVIEYIESQPDLKKLSEYFVDNLLVDMKQIIDPIYEDLHGIKLPEGKYFPRYVDVDSINDNYTTQTLTSDDGVRASSVIASAFNDRVSRTPQLDLTKGATDIINEYVKSVIYTKHFLPVAQNFDAIVNNPVSKKYIIDLIGQSRHDDLVINVNSAITGKNPYAANRIEPIMKIVNNTIVPIAAIVQVGGKFTKSAVNQSVAIISYATAGIKYGVYPTDVLRGARPLNKQELEVFKNWVFKKGGYTSRRYFDSQYDHMHIRLDKALTKWSKSTGKAKALAYTEFSRVVDATIKTYMSGILVGDFISVGAGGSAFNLAMYRKAKDNGMGHEEAMDWAYMKTAEETNLTQQSASISAKSNTQRETLSPLVLAYRSGQVAMLNKIIGSFQVLSKINKDIYSSREKVQAFADLFQFTTQMYVYNLIASGALNYMLGGDDDDETKSQYNYKVTMDTVQSMLQGYGWWGAALDMTLNAGRGKEFFNTIPAAKLIQEGATTSFWTVVKGADYGYDELTDTEVNKLQKTVGWKNIQTQIDNFNQYMKDEKSLYDAIMNYDPDKGPIEGNDYIYDKIGWMFGGEPIGGSGGSGGGPSGEGGPDEGNPDDGGPDEGVVE